MGDRATSRTGGTIVGVELAPKFWLGFIGGRPKFGGTGGGAGPIEAESIDGARGNDNPRTITSISISLFCGQFILTKTNKRKWKPF